MDSEYAVEIDGFPQWSTGAPLPHVFANTGIAYLIYLTDENDFAIIISFTGCNSHRFGIVNDEAADGHHLYEKGLQVYSAHVIENSKWIEELKTIHKVHPRFSEKHWIDYKHYLLFFHDEIFEVVATNFKIEKTNLTLKEAAIKVAGLLE